MNSSVVSSSERNYIIQGCQENCRQDGRSREEFRGYSLVVESSSTELELNQQPPLVLSNGSARVFLGTGEIHILVSVKAELVVPALNHPDEGTVNVHVDLMHKRDEELESTLSNLLIPHLVDTKKLCIVPNHYAWSLHLDVLILAASGGSLLDACSQGINAALQNTRLPKVTYTPANAGDKPTLQVDSDISKADHIPGVSGAPVIVTVSMLKCPAPVFILDASLEEESCAFAQVHVVLEQTAGEPTICALHKAGGGSLPFSLLQDLTSFVLKASTSSVCFSPDSQHHLLQENFIIQQ